MGTYRYVQSFSCIVVYSIFKHQMKQKGVHSSLSTNNNVWYYNGICSEVFYCRQKFRFD